MNNNPSSFNHEIGISTNLEDYTLSDILTILNLGDSPTKEDILRSTNKYIVQSKRANNEELAQFFQDAQTTLLEYIKGNQSTLDKEYVPAEKQTLDWWNNEVLKQPDPIQNSRITTRAQEIQLYDNEHVPMNRQQLGIHNSYNVPIAQDTLNPKLSNVTQRFINLDSQFRQATSGVESSSSDYTLTLSEPLNNVLLMYLYSIQIPHAWYTYDISYGNTCFWLLFEPKMDITVNYQISIPSGNYAPGDIASILNLGLNGIVTNSFSAPCFNWSNVKPPSATFPVSFNINNGKMTMSLYGGIYTDPMTNIQYVINETTEILFFDINGDFKCYTTEGGYNHCIQSQQNTINQTFGWYLGYRFPNIYVKEGGNTGDTIVNTFGPKYLILVIDDYNQNHINNGLVTITEESTTIKVPTYYNPSMPLDCIQPLKTSNLVYAENSLLMSEKMNISFKKIPQVVPTAPRTLTQAQIYSINEIQKNNESNTSFRGKAPTMADIFAFIPMKLNQMEVTQSGAVYIEFSGSLQQNKRVYFGPVNLERMRVKLYDDKGNILNMNGADWSFTIICEVLYQY